jgi:micrococcal nuclease
MVNEELLRAGVAVVSVYPPNVKYVDRFRAVSDSAQEARVGLWSGSAFECLPADSRAGRC